MTTPADGTVEQSGELTMSSPAFGAGEQMPDYVGYANENDNPALTIEEVPDEAESLVLIMDDPEAESVVGHVWDHWLVFDIDPGTQEIPRDWSPTAAIESYNDFVEDSWGGPAPPEGNHNYYFKLFALDSSIEMTSGIRKARIGSMIASECEILAQTQLIGQYDADQGTIF